MYTRYLTGNVQLLLIFGAFILLAFVLGQERMKRVALAAVVALYVNLQLGPVIVRFFSRYKLGFANKHVIYMVLFLLVTTLLSLGKVEHDRHKGVSIPALILGVLTAGMLVSSGIEFLSADARQRLVTDYNLYAMVVATKNWWLGLTVGWVIVMNLWHRPQKK